MKPDNVERRRTGQIAVLAWLTLLLVCDTTIAQDERFDYEGLLDAAKRTEQEHLGQAVSWTAVVELEGSSLLGIVETISTPTMKSYLVFANDGEHQELLANIVEREGLWYVTEYGQRYKCRPYEAVLRIPAVYYFLSRSKLRLVQDVAAINENCELVSQAGGIVRFRSPLPADKIRQIESSIKNFESSVATVEKREEIQHRIAAARQLINHGVEFSVDTASGIVLSLGTPGRNVRIEDVTWLTKEPEESYDVSGVTWDDKSQSLADDTNARNDLILINHTVGWTPDRGKVDSDTILLNIKTGQMRRVPIAGAAAPGSSCFSQDRTKVYVSTVTEDKSADLLEVDLLTGLTRRLLREPLSGYCMDPVLSPDGRTLAFANLAALGQGDQLLASQVFLLDVATGKMRALGKPFDTAFLSWLPDGDGLVLVSRKMVDPNKPSDSTIVRMDLSGKLTLICKGTFPYVLRSRKRIFFCNENDLWETCGLDGEDVKQVGDGLADCGFPAVGPTDLQAVIMKYGGPNGPRPNLLNLDTGELTPISLPNGLWIAPSWH